jgi:DNA-binding NtrC family response regulator
MVNCIEELTDGHFFVCGGSAMRQLRIQAELLAKANVPVLIAGEEGSGKETAARLIYQLSGQLRNPMVVIDCTQPRPGVLERVLFGDTHAASVPEDTDSAPAALGTEYQTILLKNVARLHRHNQTKIVNCLRDITNRRSANRARNEYRFRMLATCSQSIEMSVGDGSFSAELYSYLSPFTIYIPPLRRRKDEIPLLVSHFMNQVACKYALPPRLPSGTAHFACQFYSWPGNVKELEDFVKRYLIIGEAAIAFQPLKSLPPTVELVAENSSQERKRPN